MAFHHSHNACWCSYTGSRLPATLSRRWWWSQVAHKSGGDESVHLCMCAWKWANTCEATTCVCVCVCFDVCICLFFMCVYRLVVYLNDFCVCYCVCVCQYVCWFVFMNVQASLCRSVRLWLWFAVVCMTVDVFCVAKLCLLYSRWPAVLRVPVFEPAGSCIPGDGAWCWRDGADESSCSSNW